MPAPSKNIQVIVHLKLFHIKTLTALKSPPI